MSGKLTPERVRKVLMLSQAFEVTVTTSYVRVRAGHYVGLYDHELKLVSSVYTDAIEVSA